MSRWGFGPPLVWCYEVAQGGGPGTSASGISSHRVRVGRSPPRTRRSQTAAGPAVADDDAGMAAGDWVCGDVCVDEAARWGEGSGGSGRGGAAPVVVVLPRVVAVPDGRSRAGRSSCQPWQVQGILARVVVTQKVILPAKVVRGGGTAGLGRAEEAVPSATAA